MSQNCSTAVCAHVLPRFARLDKQTVLEPAANRGYLVKGLRDYFGQVIACDIYDYGAGFERADFLFPSQASWENGTPPHWVVTNPPFRLAVDFIERALDVATDGVAVLVRSAFTEGADRYKRLYRHNPPTLIAYSCERIAMVKGRYDPTASSATAYQWMIWVHGHAPRAPVWIPSCRKKMEKPGDEKW
jgi:hypothetical protein